jgi:DNA-binding NarL/FixJ family response regulator
MKRPRVLLADDHHLVAEGLQTLLAPHFDVVGIVSDGRELLSAARTHDPDVVVLDISMPSLNGIEAARQLRAEKSRAKVVFLTMHREVAYPARAMEAGGSGFVLKHSAASELVLAIQEALKGGKYITPQIAGDLLDSVRRGIPAGAEAWDELTARQREVLQLVAEGRSAKEIAAVLHISRRTAEFHKARLMETLGVESTAELVQHAIRMGVTSAEPL